MSQSSHFGSRDFWRVPSSLTARVPDRLVHRAVKNAGDPGSDSFSTERKHPVHIVDLPSFSMSMTIGGLLPGQTTRRHRHNYETLIYVVEGAGCTTVEDRHIEWSAGDVIYIPVWTWHRHQNRSDSDSCLYVACENAPMLQNLGNIALREEEAE
jgi:pyrroloquinoline-quinone synthase